MKVTDEMNHDIGVFLSRLDELTLQAKRDLLRTMFEKHMILNFEDLVLDRYDFYTILGQAKTRYANDVIPKKIGRHDITSQEAANLLLIESAFDFLSTKSALKRIPKFEEK